ncbi:MAG: PDZ domain-containing protein [Anaerolineae bacterium]|nr:PDZ domain-containing protein [Anaerolineae bacterium]
MKRFFAFLLVVGLVIGSAIAGAYIGVRIASTNGQAVIGLETIIPTQTPELVTNSVSVSYSDISTTITQVVERVGPAVVTVVGTTSGQMTFFGYSGDQEVSGSGFIITNDGYIITNNHVVEDTQDVRVILSDGSELPASVVSTDSFADLAVLKADGVMPGVAVLGNSDNLKPGETVIAIGSPLGDFRNSVTVGVVSATGRSLDTGNNYQMENLIQTDAAINSGNSGGPLVNLAGEVIGVNSAVVRGSGNSAIAEGLGFAIPSNTALLISQQIITKGYFSRPYMGVSIQQIDPSIASRYDLPVQWGAYVTRVGAGSPAGNAGIQQGDIIVRIGDKVFSENTKFVNALFAFQPGDVVEVEVMRNNQKMIFQVTLTEMSY